RLTHLWPSLARRNLLKLAGAIAITPAGMARGADQDAASAETLLWTSSIDGQTVWGYVDKHSVAPGEAFDFMLATGPMRESAPGRIQFLRVGAEGERRVWTSPEITIEHRPVSRTAATVGANWPPALSEIDTSSWPPGYYSADFVETVTERREPQIAQIVVTNPRRNGAVLLKLSTKTYHAYNARGGHSPYPSHSVQLNG